MITKKLIKQSLENGTIEFIRCPDADEEIVCKIGEYWFYFCGTFDGYSDPKEYVKNSSKTKIIDDIWTSLRGMYEDARYFGSKEDDAEYRYYEALMRERAEVV